MITECEECNITIDAKVLHAYEIGHNDNPLENIKYSFCQCGKCFNPILVRQETDYFDTEVFWGDPQKIYPINSFHINPIIPEILRNALNECIQCFKSRAYTACTIMCRRLIEGFCVVKGVKERNLETSIKVLRDNGTINEQLFEWVNQLRILGNDAAHNIEAKYSAEDAKDTLDFSIAVLDFTYSFKDKFEKFKSRTIKTKS